VVHSWCHLRKLPVVLSRTNDAQWLMKAVLAQLVMKVVGYRWLEAWAGVTALAACDLVRQEIGVWAGQVAGGFEGEWERVQGAMGAEASTLGADVRVKLTFGCAMRAATLGTDGRVKLTFLGISLTFGDPGGLEGFRVGGRRWSGMGSTVGLAAGSLAGD
jgi:hypothetical protein